MKPKWQVELEQQISVRAYMYWYQLEPSLDDFLDTVRVACGPKVIIGKGDQRQLAVDFNQSDAYKVYLNALARGSRTAPYKE